ncbi:S8 family serine peptidase [Halomonas campisalis]|uniref:S8 family serine peptidase n=1 Tax=Billgrantia campisalis TaxID=74661 RepID=A0ABS9PBD0_9GAMM|nr:S8 family serine peptidase [Halomonas campisalis]MCG6659089.1 S8 family serine peptidase [Halomonas campisalis]
MIENIVTEPRDDASDTAVIQQTERREADPQAEVQPPPAPPPREVVPDRPRVERGGSLMGQGPSSLVPPVWSHSEDPEATALTGQVPASEAADFEPGELILVSQDMSEAMATARELAGYRLRIKSRRALERLGLVVSVFRLPDGADTLALLEEIRGRFPTLSLDLNHRYRLMAGPRQRYGQEMIGLTTENTACLDSIHVGLLDTAVNLAHPALAGRSIDLAEFAGPTAAPRDHGTAIASLWVGNPDQGFTPLFSEAALSVAGVFRQRGDEIDTTTDALARGLDWLLGQEVEAINLSLGGRENRILNQTLQRLIAEEVLLVAAAGNLGPEGPAVYPAAYPGVIAVTAVDANRRPYLRANRGAYIDFAAPGVDVWAASDNGTAYHSGTSFAAPFVLAALLAEKRLDNDWLQNARESALDLGIPGKDDTYGWGLVRWPAGCG